MSEWHIRIQEYFPKEQREHIFQDKETGEKHIADVFIEESNTVIEIQYSSIKKKEFLDRTYFHLNEKRRIVWLFNESWKDKDEASYSKQYYKNGKLQKEKDRGIKGPYSEKRFKWIYRRKCVEEVQPIYQENYSVCVYTGSEGDLFHRIVSLAGPSIIVSLHDITMSKELDIEEFFWPEEHCQKLDDWESPIGLLEKRSGPTKPIRRKELKIEDSSNLGEYSEIGYDLLGNWDNEASRFLNETQEKVRSLNAEKGQNIKAHLDREDYWKALLEDADRYLK